MSTYDPDSKPQLRPVEARAVELDGGIGFLLHDPTGMAEAALSVSEPALYLMSLMDGTNTLDEIRKQFGARFHQPLSEKTLGDLVDGLEEARMLAGESFERFYAEQVDAYLAAPTRPMRSTEELGLDGDTAAVIADVLTAEPTVEPIGGRIVGLVAPHLDYPRGRVCYSAAYSTLARRAAPRRVVILGTNHFGRATSVVVSGKDFETPLGVTPTDRAFVEKLEERCGDLRAFEYDHLREHSIELQLLICQHLWGAGSFELVAALCPDPCGPTGTAPYDGNGVDLLAFGRTLGALLADDDTDTLVIAGADLSHIGMHFGDECELDDAFCAQVAERDAQALEQLGANRADSFVEQVAREDNPTRVCSAGCIFTAMTALPAAQVRVLRYHQAVDAEAQVGVTCAAAVFTE